MTHAQPLDRHNAKADDSVLDWFAGSKVVNSSGAPLVLYHGTASTFQQFNGMVWGADDPELASDYAGLRGSASGGDTIIPVIMRITNPFDADASLEDSVTIDSFFAAVFSDAQAGGRVFTQEETQRVIALAEAVMACAKREESGPHYSRYQLWYLTKLCFGKDGAEMIAKLFETAGFDGITMREAGCMTYGAFSPAQVQNAIDHGAALKARAIERDETNTTGAPVFYSKLLAALQSAEGAPNVAPAAQWIKWLDGRQRAGDIRKAEREATGVDAWLTAHQLVSREALTAYAQAHAITIEETLLSDSDIAESTHDNRLAAKYQDHSLPGGSNYREIILHLPSRGAIKHTGLLTGLEGGQADNVLTEIALKGMEELDYGRTEDDRIEFDDFTTEQRQTINEIVYSETQQTVQWTTVGDQDLDYYSSHYYTPNILAHIRLNERMDADGRRLLFVEEIQSDKGQEWLSLSKKVSAGTAGPEDTAKLELINTFAFNKTDEWVALCMRRIVRWAAEHNFDTVGWAPGIVQAERYSICDDADRVSVVPSEERHTYRLQAYKDGVTTFNKDIASLSGLDGIIGKAAAEKARDAISATGQCVLEGDDLRIGGHGMSTFYDEIVPQCIHRIFKPFDVRTDASHLFVASGKDAGRRIDFQAFDIPPALREFALTGQPMFQSAYHGTPHAFDRFDMKAVGTGEGQHAFGWGAYFSGSRAIAEGYRNMLTDCDETGALITVDIPGDELLLVWDAPLSEQPDAVREIFGSNPLFADEQIDVDGNPTGKEVTGEQIYRTMSSEFGGMEAGSRYLQQMGIPGLRYLDGSSRHGRGAGFNYVIWDDSEIKVLERDARRDVGVGMEP